MKQQPTDAPLRGALGLCMRSGSAVTGSELICTALHKKQPMYLVLLADDASDGTKKRVSDKCSFYGVPCHTLSLSASTLADALGHSGLTAAVGITSYHPARLVADKLGLALSAQDTSKHS